jgi:tRNA-dihydrouridine synthase
MVGRAALGNPWIYADLLAGREPHRRPLEEVLKEMRRFYEDVVGEMGEARAARYMRKFYGWYLDPFGPSGDLSTAFRRAAGFEEVAKLARRLEG